MSATAVVAQSRNLVANIGVATFAGIGGVTGLSTGGGGHNSLVGMRVCEGQCIVDAFSNIGVTSRSFMMVGEVSINLGYVLGKELQQFEGAAGLRHIGISNTFNIRDGNIGGIGIHHCGYKSTEIYSTESIVNILTHSNLLAVDGNNQLIHGVEHTNNNNLCIGSNLLQLVQNIVIAECVRYIAISIPLNELTD